MNDLDMGVELRFSQSVSTGDELFTLLCERRGWTDAYLRRIEDSSHDELKDCATMAEFLETARINAHKITIAPDFDMDGIASGVLGYAGLKELGFDVELHLPDYRRGHDLGPADIDEIHARWPSTRVLLTCDGGVNSHDGIAAARARGWATLVTDHHQEREPGCAADITVNPCRLDETYALRGICGAHVLYQVLEHYTRAHQPYKLAAIRWLRLFAGLGTVSDVMPMLYENRQLVRDSLSIARLLWTAAPKDRNGDTDPERIDVEEATMMRLLRSEVHHPVFVSVFEGFAQLLKAFTQYGKVRDLDEIDEGFYGFYLAPAMNAPRRTGGSLADCFAVFTCAQPADKLAAAHRVIENNELRKQLVTGYVTELDGDDQPLAPWVYFSTAATGMLGLLAAQMMQRHGHPVVVMGRPSVSGQQISGSARAPGWFDIIDVLDPHPGLSAIGHAQACGVRAEDLRGLSRLAEVLRAETLIARRAPAAMTGPSADLVLGPDDDCDAPLNDLEPIGELVRRLATLRPFGADFVEPSFCLVVEPTRCTLARIGSEGQHLRLVTSDGLACLWWNAAETEYERLRQVIDHQHATRARALADHRSVPAQESFRFTVRLQLNHWAGAARLQAVVTELAYLPETPA